MALTLATFNAENLFLRYRFMEQYPGGRKPKATEETRDHDRWGFVPLYKKGMFRIFNETRRKLTAQAIRDDGAPPDILCLQEVESLLALREFNERYLDGHYPYALVIDGRDLRRINVAVLGRRPFRQVRTHVDDRTPDGSDFVFRRDCLEVTVDLEEGGGEPLMLFICHLKSRYVGNARDRKRALEQANRTRLSEASAVAAIVRDRFPGDTFDRDLFAVVGDFNDQSYSPHLKPLVHDLGLENAVNRLPMKERWTHWCASRNLVSQMDYLLLSPALARLTEKKRPSIERRGLGCTRRTAGGGILPKHAQLIRTDDGPGEEVPFDFERFPDVTADIEASGHCPVFLKIASRLRSGRS